MCMRLKLFIDNKSDEDRKIEYMKYIFSESLSYKVENAFKKNNITVKDILNNKYKLHQFLQIKNLGIKSINEIKEYFKQIGYVFPDNHDWENGTIRNKGERLNNYLKTNI